MFTIDPFDWLRSVIGSFLPRNAPRYAAVLYDGAGIFNGNGLIEQSAFSGKVLAGCAAWILLKIKLGEFAVVSTSMLAEVPPVGASVTITPYRLLHWNGTPLRQTNSGPGGELQSTEADISDLPIDKDSLQNSDLIDLVTIIETQRTQSRMRTIAQVLIDAGANAQASLGYRDLAPDEVDFYLPAIQFRVTSPKHRGLVTIEVAKHAAGFNIHLVDFGLKEVCRVVCATPAALASEVERLISDPAWRLAQVTNVTKRDLAVAA